MPRRHIGRPRSSTEAWQQWSEAVEFVPQPGGQLGLVVDHTAPGVGDARVPTVDAIAMASPDDARPARAGRTASAEEVLF